MNKNRIDLDKRIGLPEEINLEKDRLKLYEIPSEGKQARDLYNKYFIICKDKTEAKIICLNVIQDIMFSYSVVYTNVYRLNKIISSDFNDGFLQHWNNVYDIIDKQY